MSLAKPDLHLRLCEEARGVLRLLAEVEGLPDSALAARYLEESLLGRFYAIKVAATRAARLGIHGSLGEY
ncbi:hypothetical protein [uncultured Thiodictyon sp.]|uniref:hypothetical protein n=1 Tax=uncultured Thiodictyon sp. TaxID=1846217 RepID=UPI0025F6B564|nr:hypothetical protein [uncultured Thiodictyon sp.]